MQLNNELMISVTSPVWLQQSVNGCSDDDFTTAIDDNLNAIEHQSMANLFISGVDENSKTKKNEKCALFPVFKHFSTLSIASQGN